jgi:hypothetical protein
MNDLICVRILIALEIKRTKRLFSLYFLCLLKTNNECISLSLFIYRLYYETKNKKALLLSPMLRLLCPYRAKLLL